MQLRSKTEERMTAHGHLMETTSSVSTQKLNHTRNRKVWCWFNPFVKYPNLRGLHGERFPLNAALFQDISSNSCLPPGQKYQDNFLVYSIFVLLYKSVPKSKVYRVIREWNIRKVYERDNRDGFVLIIFFPKSFVTLGVACAEGKCISKADDCIIIVLIKQLDNCIRGSQKCSVNADYILFSPGISEQTVCPYTFSALTEKRNLCVL